MKKIKKSKRFSGLPNKKKQTPRRSSAPHLQNILRQAMALHQSGNLQQAESLYRQILLTDPDHPEALHYLGILALEMAQYNIAVELMSRAVSLKPEMAEAHYNLGNALEEIGKQDEAAASLRKAISLKPNYVEAHYNLGILMQAQGRLEEAVTSFRQATLLRPNFAEAHNNLGIALQSRGKLEEAAASFRKALKLKPDYSAAHNNLGILLQAEGKLEEAATCFKQALSQSPNYVAAYSNLGIVFKEQGKLEEAVACFRDALILQPENAEAHNNLGIVFKEQGKLEEAVACFRKALILQPDNAETHNNLGNTLNELGKADEAAVSYDRALTLQPDYAEAHYNLGLMFSQLGKADDARRCFRKAITLKADYAQAYKGLSSISKFSREDKVIREMEVLFHKKETMLVSERIDLGFALGKVFEDHRDYDKAFEYILAANKLKRATYEYSVQHDKDFFKKIKKVFSAAFFASHQGSGYLDKTPIFIVGMPRSGTTLVEQILASHPLVFGAGELTVLTNLINNICAGETTAPFPECMLDLDLDSLEKMGADYVAQMRRYSDQAEYITDKLPGNFLRIGLIKTILPNAKVVHCMRSPMDTCFSIFKNDFSKKHSYAYDMDELGRYYTFYSDLMAHWETILPGFMHSLRYEEMVANQLKETEKLLDFCGLPWVDTCLSFHKTKRKVDTASLAQVRQPLYNDSVGLWKRYENHLLTLKKAIYENQLNLRQLTS